jgi:hypothetical protein
MALYFFRAHYRGMTLTDDVGEEFASPKEAEAHAVIVARELARNDAQPVTVFVVSEDGDLIATTGALGD